jgi:hypothetical protein
MWCSQACRRAAYEERRAAARGAVALRVVDRVELVEHPLGTCVDRAIASPAGCRRVVQQLTRLAREGALQADPRWLPTAAALTELILHLAPGPRRHW